MKKLVLLLALFITATTFSQDRIGLTVQAQPKLITVGDSNVENGKRILDLLVRVKQDYKQGDIGYWNSALSYQYIALDTSYSRYALQGGYTFNKFSNKYKVGLYADLGVADRGDIGFTYAAGIDLNYIVTKRFSITLTDQFARRTDMDDFQNIIMLGFTIDLIDEEEYKIFKKE